MRKRRAARLTLTLSDWSADRNRPPKERNDLGRCCLDFISYSTSALPRIVQLPTVAPLSLTHTLSDHKGPIHTVVYNANNSYILSGGQDRQIKLWNAKSGAKVKNYQGHGYEVLGLCVAPTNDKFASCGGDRDVFYWDVSSGDVVRKYNGHTGKVNAVAFNTDASVLASGSYDTTVRLWDIKSQQRMPIQILSEAKDSITSIVIHKHLIVVGSVDGYVRTYDVRQGEMRTDFFDQPVTSVSLSTDTSILLISTLDSTIRALDLSNGHLFQSFSGHKNDSYRSKATFGKNEQSVVFGDEEGVVWEWDVESGKEVSKFKAHERTILWTLHHPKEEQVITASADGTIKIWNK